MMNNFSFIKKVILGFVIGIAAITPGVSGGVIAASFGIYDRIIDSVTYFYRDFKKNMSYLLPFGLGGIAGVLFFSNILKSFMVYSHFEVMYIFTGLILGTVPHFIRSANKNGFKVFYPFLSAVVFILSIYIGKSTSYTGLILETKFLRLLLVGAVLSIGTVVPGLSSSLILMQLGLYNEYIDIISRADILSSAHIFIGFAFVTLIIIKIVSWCFKTMHGASSYVVLGLLISSVFLMFPGFRDARRAAVDISLCYLSFVFSFLMMSFKPQA